MGVLIRTERHQRCTCTDKATRGHRKNTATCEPRGEASETSPADTLSLNVQPPGLGGVTLCCVSPPVLMFAAAALVDQGTTEEDPCFLHTHLTLTQDIISSSESLSHSGQSQNVLCKMHSTLQNTSPRSSSSSHPLSPSAEP